MSIGRMSYQSPECPVCQRPCPMKVELLTYIWSLHPNRMREMKNTARSWGGLATGDEMGPNIDNHRQIGQGTVAVLFAHKTFKHFRADERRRKSCRGGAARLGGLTVVPDGVRLMVQVPPTKGQ